jgi:hypothetical protein
MSGSVYFPMSSHPAEGLPEGRNSAVSRPPFGTVSLHCLSNGCIESS